MQRFLLSLLLIAVITSCKNKSIDDVQLPDNKVPEIKISLAQWSFHRALRNGEMDNVQFIEKAAEMGFSGVEYVNQFFIDKAQDTAFLNQLKTTAQRHNIQQVLIMIDEEGNLADTSLTAREEAVVRHQKWIDAATYLGCHAIRVNLYGYGDKKDVAQAGMDGLSKLADYAATKNLNILVENHGGYSSDAAWLTDIVKSVNKPNLGTLPDFSNFCIQYEGGNMWGTNCTEAFDKYLGVQLMMPYAKGISAKSFDFGEMGYETSIDYNRMMEIIFKSGFSGYIGVEYEGDSFSEEKGTQMTKKLLEKCIKEQQIKM